MKTSHFLALPLLLVVLHLSSCESIVTDVELPKADPVLTVYGFVSPDEPHINIRVGRSMPIYTRPVTGSDTVADAVVTLYCDGRSVQIPYRGQSWYSVPTGSFPIPPGSTCSLVVTTPRGERVTGQTLIPNQFAEVVRSELVQVEDPFGFNQDFVQVFWDDLPGTDDYYHFIAREVSIFSGDTNRYVQASEVIDSRDARNGQFSARIPVYLNGGTPGDSAHFELALATTGRDYYRYHLLRLDYFGDNPFAEPTVMHRNVEGGEGVFAGYRCKSVRLKIPYRSTP